MRLLLVLAVAGLAACGASNPSAALAPPTATTPSCTPTGGDQRVDGVLLHIPPHARAPLALVIAFHGAGGNGDDFAGYTGLSATADAHGFAVLYPSASSRTHFWALNRAMGTRDIDALRALIPKALAAACGDPTRVYATGVSNGGGFTARVGCELQLAAIAPVAGGYRALDETCEHRTSVLEIHGTSDTVVPYDGKPPDRRGAVVRYLDAWADRNGCSRSVTTHPRRHVTRLRYTDCDEGLAVEHLKLDGTGHGWPGADPPWPRQNPSQLLANEATWRFFADKRSIQ